MKSMKRLIASKIIWFLLIYSSTMFAPYREIKKGQSTFVTLPLWWEYGNVVKNYTVIFLHFAVSLGFALILSRIFCRKFH
jgi:hypothetical protein